MKTSFFSKILSTLLGLIPISFVSCKKMVEVVPPLNEIVTSTVFSDSLNANSAVVGIYVNIMNSSFDFNLANGTMAIYTGMSADDLYPTRGFPEEDEFFQNSILTNPDNYINANFWQSAYKFIYQVNACIEGLTNSTTLTQQTKDKLLGECIFIRAYLYFNMVNLYGDVPLVKSTDFHLNATLPRTPATIMWAAIEEDLKSAVSLLPEDNLPNRTRPGKGAAKSLLARVYLFLDKWSESEQLCSTVINNSNFQLESDLNNVFLPGSKEILWQIIPVDPGFNTPLGVQLNPTPLGRPPYAVTDNLLNSFEANDARKAIWLKSKTVNSVTYNYPFKYKLRYDGNSSPSEYFVPLRLAELFLIRSEARARQNNLSAAKDDLNLIRIRSGLQNTTATTQSEILTAVESERRLELFGEEGHRWLDLKRTGKANSILLPLKTPNWQITDELYPIPFIEILYNPKLIQNPGY